MDGSTTTKRAGASVGGYAVARPLGKCNHCDRVIASGEKFVAALRETPQGLERLDLHPVCWEQLDKAQLLAFWHATMPNANVRRRVFVDDAVLCDLFERTADAAESAKLNFRFVLGLILMRKRLLIYEGSRLADGAEYWLMRLRGQEQTMELLNPRLNEQQIAEVSQQLGEVLNAEAA